MKRFSLIMCALGVAGAIVIGSRAATVDAQQPAAAATPAPTPVTVPEIPFDSNPTFLKYSADMNLGEVLGITVNSKGQIMVLNHPGSATSGPVYGNASTQLFLFDASGKFLKEVGKGVYGLAYGHSIRFDKYDNLWVVDKGTNAVTKFNPDGFTVMNLGRRPEGPDDPSEFYYRVGRGTAPPVHVDNNFRQPTDIAWDSDDNIYITDGYTNSRVAKYDKNGNWMKTWGSRGPGGAHANENPGQFNTLHNIGVDKQNNIYVADRNNRRIQVFDTDGNFKRFIFLNATYDKKRHPVLANLTQNRPDETQPWTICITNTTPQYLYTSDDEPGRIYKLTLDGKIIGTLGKSGHEVKQFNWIHAIACPAENDLLVADMNNWRVQKLTLHPDRMTTSTGQ